MRVAPKKEKVSLTLDPVLLNLVRREPPTEKPLSAKIDFLLRLGYQTATQREAIK